MRKLISIFLLFALILPAGAQFRGTGFFSAPAAGGGGMSSLNDAAAYWTMDEGSGVDRADATGNGQTLSWTGTLPDATTGLINNAAVVTGAAGGRKFRRAHESAISCAGTDFTFCIWGRLRATMGSTGYMFAKYAGSGQGWVVYWNSTLRFQFQDQDIDSTINSNTYVDTWVFMLVSFTNSSKTGRLLVVDSSGSTLADVTGVSSTAISETSGYLDVGGVLGSNTGTPVIDYDECGFWKRLLSPTEITFLINSGAGKQYPY